MTHVQEHVPLIGIVPTYVPEEDIFRLKQNYCQAIERWGGMPLILPMTDDVRIYEYLLPQIDGFLFTGGHDISPECYGEERRSDKLSPLTPNRDRMEDRILNYAYDYDIPVLGVCRGMQMMNVYFGGTLYQDLADEYRSIGGNRWAIEGVYLPDGSPDATQSTQLAPDDIRRGSRRYRQAQRPPAPIYSGLLPTVPPGLPLPFAVRYHEHDGGDDEHIDQDCRRGKRRHGREDGDGGDAQPF